MVRVTKHTLTPSQVLHFHADAHYVESKCPDKQSRQPTDSKVGHGRANMTQSSEPSETDTFLSAPETEDSDEEEESLFVKQEPEQKFLTPVATRTAKTAIVKLRDGSKRTHANAKENNEDMKRSESPSKSRKRMSVSFEVNSDTKRKKSSRSTRVAGKSPSIPPCRSTRGHEGAESPSRRSSRAAATNATRKIAEQTNRSTRKKSATAGTLQVEIKMRNRAPSTLVKKEKASPTKKPRAQARKYSPKKKSDSEEFEIDRIIDSRLLKATGTIEYLVKWKGYKDSDNSWEPTDNLGNCDLALSAYYKRVKRQRKK